MTRCDEICVSRLSEDIRHLASVNEISLAHAWTHFSRASLGVCVCLRVRSCVRVSASSTANFCLCSVWMWICVHAHGAEQKDGGDRTPLQSQSGTHAQRWVQRVGGRALALVKISDEDRWLAASTTNHPTSTTTTRHSRRVVCSLPFPHPSTLGPSASLGSCFPRFFPLHIFFLISHLHFSPPPSILPHHTHTPVQEEPVERGISHARTVGGQMKETSLSNTTLKSKADIRCTMASHRSRAACRDLSPT